MCVSPLKHARGDGHRHQSFKPLLQLLPVVTQQFSSNIFYHATTEICEKSLEKSDRRYAVADSPLLPLYHQPWIRQHLSTSTRCNSRIRKYSVASLLITHNYTVTSLYMVGANHSCITHMSAYFRQGWAGNTLARRLDKRHFDVRMISPSNHFLFSPLLYV